MARKKDQPKPLFLVKHDFVDSLDNLTQVLVNYISVIDTAIELGAIDKKILDRVVDQQQKLKSALLTND